MRRLTLTVSALCVIVVGVATLQGAPVFDAPRWEILTPAPDSTTIPTAAGSASPTPVANPEAQRPVLDLDPQLLLLVLLVFLAYIVGLLLMRRRWWAAQRETIPIEAIGEAAVLEAPHPDDDDGLPVRGIRRGLDAARDRLAEEGSPGDAIVAAWRGLEESAEDSGIPRRASQTPSEFTASLLSRVAGAGDDVRLLLGLYLSVRYGGHVADEQHIAAAREAVDRLRERWNT